MIIEFAGSSCSGKSTLINQLTAELERRGIPLRVANAWSSSRRDVLRATRKPGLVAWGALNPRLMFRSGGRQLLGAVGYVLTLRQEPGVVLLDEGPIKLHKRPILRASRAPYLLRASLPVPDLMVLVTCDPAERLVRVREAGRVYALDRSDEEILADTTDPDWALRFASLHKVPVAHVDTSGEKDGLPQLLPVLEPYLAARHYPAARDVKDDVIGLART